jgi:spore germination protein PF
MSGIPYQVVIDVVNGGVVNVGGSLSVSPINAIKTIHGSGSSNTGIHNITINGVSSSNFADTDKVDQPIV